MDRNWSCIISRITIAHPRRRGEKKKKKKQNLRRRQRGHNSVYCSDNKKYSCRKPQSFHEDLLVIMADLYQFHRAWFMYAYDGKDFNMFGNCHFLKS